MKNPFKRGGFDSLVSKDTTFNNGKLLICANQIIQFDGTFIGDEVVQGGENKADKTEFVVGGLAKVKTIRVANVTVTGRVECDLLVVEGRLAVKAGAEVLAKEIQYRHLTIENGAKVQGQMQHLDLVGAAGEA